MACSPTATVTCGSRGSSGSTSCPMGSRRSPIRRSRSRFSTLPGGARTSSTGCSFVLRRVHRCLRRHALHGDMDALTPTYWLSGVIKAITAAASVPTAVLLVRLLPRPSPSPPRNSSPSLTASSAARRSPRDARVRERTAELVEKTEQLAREIAERKRSDARFRRLAESGVVGIMLADGAPSTTRTTRSSTSSATPAASFVPAGSARPR